MYLERSPHLPSSRPTLAFLQSSGPAVLSESTPTFSHRTTGMFTLTAVDPVTGRASFICRICSKKDKTKQKHVIHVRTHTKEKPFKCPGCSYATGDDSNLRKHSSKCRSLNLTMTSRDFSYKDQVPPGRFVPILPRCGPVTIEPQEHLEGSPVTGTLLKEEQNGSIPAQNLGDH